MFLDNFADELDENGCLWTTSLMNLTRMDVSGQLCWWISSTPNLLSLKRPVDEQWIHNHKFWNVLSLNTVEGIWYIKQLITWKIFTDKTSEARKKEAINRTIELKFRNLEHKYSNIKLCINWKFLWGLTKERWGFSPKVNHLNVKWSHGTWKIKNSEMWHKYLGHTSHSYTRRNKNPD